METLIKACSLVRHVPHLRRYDSRVRVILERLLQTLWLFSKLPAAIGVESRLDISVLAQLDQCVLLLSAHMNAGVDVWVDLGFEECSEQNLARRPVEDRVGQGHAGQQRRNEQQHGMHGGGPTNRAPGAQAPLAALICTRFNGRKRA